MFERQRGAALVFAMVVLLVVAGLAATIATQFEFSIRSAENRLHGGQAQAYLGGTESLGIAILARDSRMSANTDHLAEDWARKVPDFPVEGGWVRASLEDAQGRFNINSLVHKARSQSAASGEAARFTAAQRRFIRLLQTFEQAGLSQAESIEVTEAVIDWLDEDDEVTGFGGAESDYYLRLQQAYRPANGPLVDITELRQVRFITPELYQQLRDYLVALPQDVGLNVNTASIPLLQTINQQDELRPLDRYAAERVARWRDEGHAFESLEAFLQHEQLLALQAGENQVIAEGLGVRSDYFLLRGEAEVMGRYRVVGSLLKRGSGGVSVVRRGLF